jgi:hypothetical protein
MTICENIEAVAEAEAAVKAHCMCRAFHMDDCYYHVLYPAGFTLDGLDGVQFCYLYVGKAVALQRLLKSMERCWLESFPGYQPK